MRHILTYTLSLCQVFPCRFPCKPALRPLRRLAIPDDVAAVTLFYASPLADFVTGANIAPDGGLAVL